eukprot:g83037.t1
MGTVLAMNRSSVLHVAFLPLSAHAWDKPDRKEEEVSECGAQQRVGARRGEVRVRSARPPAPAVNEVRVRSAAASRRPRPRPQWRGQSAERSSE